MAPYLRSLKRRQKLHPSSPAWAALDIRWQVVTRACQETIKLREAGLPGSGWEFEAAAELVKVSEQAPAEAVWKRVLAMFLLREDDPNRFVSERAFRTQLGRLVRHLADTSRASYYNPRLGRFISVYRDPSPRSAVIIGNLLNEAFGVAGVWVSRQEKAEAAAKETERQGFYDALRDITPAGSGL